MENRHLPHLPQRARLESEHKNVYNTGMKRRELEQKLSELGWRFLRRGGRHDIWTNGQREIAVPRHREINEYTARAILREAGA